MHIMCGIAGWIDWERDLLAERTSIQRMAGSIAHRGPDAEGIWISNIAALAHRRLAVLDLPGGTQPMSVGNVILTFSGEIHNFLDLRRDLQEYGYRFHTSSDTEVLIYSYLQWGQDCVQRLNGMYAFAIWDTRQEILLLVRDRLGIKPLYYVKLPTGLLFASELKSLLSHPEVRSTVGVEGIAELFTAPPGKTPGLGIYKDVYELKPGSLLSCSRRGVRERTYWKLASEPHKDDLPTTEATVRGLIETAVSSQMTSDVPLCTLLSGGVDSSVLTALANRESTGRSNGPLGTFSIALSDSQFSPSVFQTSQDAPYAAQVARYLRTDHREIRLDSSDLLEHMNAPLGARDLPGMGDIDVSLYLLFRQVKEQYTVALSGESADELFRGYAWMHQDWQATNTFPWIYPAPRHLDIRSSELCRTARLDEYEADQYSDALAEVPHLGNEGSTARRQRELAYLTLTRFLPALLDRKDRLSMAVGLEVRVPYCDHHLVEYTWNVPYEMHRSARVEKSLLRKMATDLLPQVVAMRPKSHYPSTQSSVYEQAIKERVRDWLADRTALSRDFFDLAKVKQIIESNDSYALTRPSLPWLLEFDAWLRKYGITVTL